MKIALISEHASPLATLGGVDADGPSTYVGCVASYLVEAGHQVDVLTRRDSPGLSAVVKLRPGLTVIHVPAGPPRPLRCQELLPHMRDFVSATERLIQQGHHYDVIHANRFMSGLVAMQLKERFGIPFVMTFHTLARVQDEHQPDALHFQSVRRTLEHRIVAHADRIIAACPEDEQDLLRLYQADAQRIAVVPCGVDLYQFHPMDKQQARARLGLAPEEFIALQLGRIAPHKGIDTVIQALSCLDDRIPARLLVVGGSSAVTDDTQLPEPERLQQLAVRCGVGHRVEFTGHCDRSDLRSYYAAADVFVTTPWYEPFGITPLEAMACGTPVIGSAVGGIPYSVLDGVTGYLVPPKNPQSLARCLTMLHDNPSMAQALGRAGTRRVRSKFTWDRVTSDLLGVYQDVCAQAGPSTRAMMGMAPAMPATIRSSSARAATRA
ncbi:MAG: glycosyltransferase family 1 protein [Rubrivivax sp.]|nr:MAG: glycosyltransferase family 1 protein [Rubrivivax sp.]